MIKMKKNQNSGEDDGNGRPNKKGGTLNREMAVVTYIFMALFVIMACYVVYFVVQDSDEVLNNTANKRQELLANRVTKGSILSSDGKILAETVTNDSGNEVRKYPYAGLFSHVIGRSTHGKTGLEAAESYTMLTTGVHPFVQTMNELSGKKSPGNNVVTTLSVTLSKAADEALGNHKGAVVVMDPETGKILVMISKPTYDPNNLTEAVWNRLTTDKEEESALYNRATQGLYPPGSTFKLYTALEYMRENKKYNRFKYTCTGSIGKGNGKISCYGGEVHGAIDLSTAFAKSCNAAFCKIGSTLDVSGWKNLCESLYYNKKIPLDDLSQSVSRFSLEKTTQSGDIMQAAIGQGDTLVSPLQNILLVCAAVNDGVLMKPYVKERIEDAQGNTIESTEPEKLAEPITAKEAAGLKKLMRTAVTQGTASSLYYGTTYKAGGKTGSAEFESGSDNSHAWFVGYAQADGRKLAVSIVVEAAGTGSRYAVPIAKKIFDAYW